MRARARLVAGVMLLAAGAAHAADRGFYFGLSGGQAKYDFDTPAPISLVFPETGFLGGVAVPDPVVRLNPGPIFSGPIFSEPAFGVASRAPEPFGGDDKDSAWGLTAGYRAGRYVAVELNYFNLGTLEASTSVLVLVPPLVPPFTAQSMTLRRELETSGPALSVLGILPLSDSWEVYLRGGVLFADMKLTTSLGDNSNSTTFGSEAAALGAGAQFNWGDHWSARVEFQRFLEVGDDLGEADIDLLSLGVLYRL